MQTLSREDKLKHLTNKNDAVEELVIANYSEITDTKQKRALVKQLSEKYGLKVEVIRYAYANFISFGRTDLTVKYIPPKYEENIKIIESYKKYNAKKHIPYPVKEYSTKKAGNLLHEYIFDFDSSRGSALRFFKKYKINYHQFYSWLRELTLHGTILGRKIYDPSEFNKMSVRTAIRLEQYTRQLHHWGETKNVKSRFDQRSQWQSSDTKNLTDDEVVILRKLASVLDSNL